ncbi:MAG: hypothetical protein HUK07_02350 [Bacteroidaceae bacterium]|nr:hypothetical protein [Bacteroidaceae bacterium]
MPAHRSGNNRPRAIRDVIADALTNDWRKTLDKVRHHAIISFDVRERPAEHRLLPDGDEVRGSPPCESQLVLKITARLDGLIP